MSNILDQIVESRRKDYMLHTFSEPDAESTLSRLRDSFPVRNGVRSFRESLRKKVSTPKTAAIIAEIKRGSPSNGLFAPDLDPISCAEEYESGGAACLSVLTEPSYFFGKLEDLIDVRNHCSLPVLRKDFIVSEYQVKETAIFADCMLLIARCLDAAELKRLHDLALELQMETLVEVFDEQDIEKITPFRFPLVGINHRNLATMELNMERTQLFARSFAPDQTLVAASGIHSRMEIEQVMQTGITSFLIGESLSKSANRSGFLKELVG
ncbi:MAG: indole-3-glycerol phosphate synthase TrpC [Planctomycetaceae bacterium]|nr:indole-3-glycerol phosphate synthase TrpC [Planctomycetaceae bacterium]